MVSPEITASQKIKAQNQLKRILMSIMLKSKKEQAAAGEAGHTSTKMAELIYGLDQAKRIHQELKDLDIDLR